jgi:AraC-like DNA-binding protein
VAVSCETRRFIGTDAALFLGPLPPASVHSHHAIQGCVALRGRLRVDVESQEPVWAAGALVAPDVPHAVSASGLVAHFYALPESPAGSRLVAALAGRHLIDFKAGKLAEVRCLLVESLADERLFPQCLESLLDLALQGAPPAPRRDARVSTALASLRFRSADTPLAVLAREAGLSPDRLRHLIREETGIPLRSFRKWARLLRAIEALRDTGSVTAAAHTSGFADTAHLSRVFRESFTFPPSVFLRNSRVVQARRGGSQ